MIYNGKEIPKELFILDKSDIYPEGLQGYVNRISEYLEIEITFAEKSDGTQYETSLYFPDERLIIIPSRFVYKGLNENDYLAAKGAIDHEIGHFFWPDYSYLPEYNENEEDQKLIHDFGNIIDDIRIEQRMTENFDIEKSITDKVGADKNNFKYFLELNYASSDINDIRNDLLNVENLFYMAVHITYRDVDFKYYKKENVDKWELFQNELKPVIDNFFKSNGDAKDTAEEIINLLVNNMSKKIVTVLQKGENKEFLVDIDGVKFYLSLTEDAPDFLNERDQFYSEPLKAMLGYINLQVIEPEDMEG